MGIVQREGEYGVIDLQPRMVVGLMTILTDVAVSVGGSAEVPGAQERQGLEVWK
jgi:hypothetical protein